MSQYPHYPGYPAGYGEFDPGAPARRAAILMFILGAIGIIGGCCIGGTGLLIRDFITQPQFASALARSHATAGQMQASMLVGGGICLVGGILLIVLGIFVRRGTTGPIVGSIILNVFALLVIGLILLSTLVAAGNGSDPTIASGICVMTIPALLLIVLLIWLVAALRNVPYMRASSSMQYWQYPQDYYPFPSGEVPPPPPAAPPPDFQPPKQ